MGILNFFGKLFGAVPKREDETPVMQTTTDPVKDASDYVMPQPEMASEMTEPALDKPSLANDGGENLEDLKRADRDRSHRFDEEAD